MSERDDRQYAKEHEWAIFEEDGTCRVGISFYAQKELGNLVFANLPEVGDTVTAGMPFADVEEPRDSLAIKGAHARAIIRFLRQLPDEVTDLYVCCSRGSSRSPAVAAAILRMSGRKDDVVWKNPFYVPNKLVYQVLCREFGLFAPDWYVKRKAELNWQSYMRAARYGDADGYERWQIIE